MPTVRCPFNPDITHRYQTVLCSSPSSKPTPNLSGMILKYTITLRSSRSHAQCFCHALSTRSRTHLCGLDLNLTYPQNGYFPTLNPPLPAQQSAALDARLRLQKTAFVKQALKQDALGLRSGTSKRDPAVEEARFAKRMQWKRDLSGRANGTIDPYYQCDLWGEMIDYALNFSLPWRECPDRGVFPSHLLTSSS